jgi:L-threonylcarbamoyladenylate synthase
MTARILQAHEIARAVTALRRGQLVAIPTETVYGLAGLAHDPDALLRIFAAKERPTFDPLIVHVPPSPAGTRLQALADMRIVDVGRMAESNRAVAAKLLDAFWPGPLTLVLPKSSAIPDLCTAGLDRVAVRMPAHPLAQQILLGVGQPLAAPSANRFGRISPTTAQHVFDELGERIDWIVDGGPCEVGVESTVVRVEDSGACVLLRRGGVTREALETALGQPVTEVQESPGTLSAPGQLASHYAPGKPLRMLPKPLQELSLMERQRLFQSGAVVLVTRGDGALELSQMGTLHPIRVVLLSPDGSDVTAARRLFACLRKMDESPGDLYFEPIAEAGGLWPAIADRLARASAPRD